VYSGRESTPSVVRTVQLSHSRLLLGSWQLPGWLHKRRYVVVQMRSGCGKCSTICPCTCTLAHARNNLASPAVRRQRFEPRYLARQTTTLNSSRWSPFCKCGISGTQAVCLCSSTILLVATMRFNKCAASPLRLCACNSKIIVFFFALNVQSASLRSRWSGCCCVSLD
jgi:hypothetical protein